MEAEQENTANVELFWTLFNEALTKINQAPVKFNPIGWCTNMAGANLAGISKVFGDSACIKTCEFHFKDCRNKKAKTLNADSAQEFKSLCDNLLYSTTTVAYDSAKKEMDKFVKDKEVIIYDYSSQSNKCYNACCCSCHGVERNTKQFTID